MINAAWSWTARHGAIGPGNRQATRFGAFGSGSCLAFPPGAIFGERWIRVGRDTLIGPHVSISAGMVPGQKMVTDPVVRIGDRCMIGRGSHIVGHFQLEIGDDVHTGPYVYITDQNHGYKDPDQVVHVQWPTDVPVLIGSGSWIGTGVVILPGTVLGRNVVVGAGAVVRGTFPDHCVIAGVPARVVRRYVPGSGWVAGNESTASAATTDSGTSDASLSSADLAARVAPAGPAPTGTGSAGATVVSPVGPGAGSIASGTVGAVNTPGSPSP
jgi:acetyltransferase-like isoleucine patch superfamily enzyme